MQLLLLCRNRKRQKDEALEDVALIGPMKSLVAVCNANDGMEFAAAR